MLPQSNRGRALRTVVAVAIAGASILGIRASRADDVARRPPTPLSEPPFGQYLGACTADSDCTGGGVCFAFKKRGPHCTHACQAPSDCAAPSHGCTKLNHCGLGDPKKTEP